MNAVRTPMTARQRWVLILASVGAFMISMDSLIVTTALTTIRRDLGASIETSQWIVNAYNLAFAVLLVTGAALGDRFGRRRGFVAGLGLFAAASAACALSPGTGWLIAARAMQGAGGALVLPLALTLLAAAFPPQRRGWALGIFVGVVGLGSLLGPLVGGAVVQGLAWQGVFWINVPIGAAAILLARWRMDESRGPQLLQVALGYGPLAAGLGLMPWSGLRALSGGTAARRLLPEERGPAADRPPEGAPLTEVAWLEPYPDAALDLVADAAPGPDARYEMREAVQLAFVAAIQHLPPRQRAVLLLRDVLGWSAAETAALLEASVASINSALQRARATLETRLPRDRPGARPAASRPDAGQRVLLERYVRAWETDDVEGLVALLREDAVLSMPPFPHWYRGHDAIRFFLEWVWREGPPGRFRLLPTAANGQPAYGVYDRGPDAVWRLRTLQVVTLEGAAVTAITSFRDRGLFAAFGLGPVLGEQRAGSPS